MKGMNEELNSRFLCRLTGIILYDEMRTHIIRSIEVVGEMSIWTVPYRHGKKITG